MEKERGRFDAPFTVGGGAKALLAGMWDGFRLRCPACSRGKLFASGLRIHEACTVCGVPFERPDQGDFLGAMVTIYSITAFIATNLILPLYLWTDLSLKAQLAIAVPLTLAFVALLYRNMKGIWVAIFVALIKWIR